MKKMLQVTALSVMGCLFALVLSARPAIPPSVSSPNLSYAQQEGYQYKIYLENGKYVGTCTVSDPAALNSYVRKLGKGTYVFIEVNTNSLTEDRRIIVY